MGVVLAVASSGRAGEEPDCSIGGESDTQQKHHQANSVKLTRYTGSRIRMGVPFNITVYARGETIAIAAMDDAYRRIKELNKIFSDYNPHSEVRRIEEKAEAGKPISISEDLRILLEKSIAISRQTNGTFDVTVSPVVKLWRRADRSGKKPTPAQIQAASARVGWEHLKVVACTSTLTFQKPGMELDFGAIAKGYACDEALEVLAGHGIKRALVEAGGDMTCGDPPPGKNGWTIALPAYGDRKDEKARYLVVANAGVATSGDLYQFSEFGGIRYSHIIDPDEGKGLTSRSRVTVIAPNGTEADALATAVSVLGPKKGLCLVESLKSVEMMMVYQNEEGSFQTVASEGFAKYFMDEETVGQDE